MSHFAKVVDGRVVKVIAADQSFIDNYKDDSPGHWLQTSYRTYGNVHYGPDGQPDNGVALRGNFAGIGYVYDSANDVFYEPDPQDGRVLDTETWMWVESDTEVPDWRAFRSMLVTSAAYGRITGHNNQTLAILPVLVNVAFLLDSDATRAVEFAGLWNAIASIAQPTTEEITALNAIAAANNIPFALNEQGLIQ